MRPRPALRRPRRAGRVTALAVGRLCFEIVARLRPRLVRLPVGQSRALRSVLVRRTQLPRPSFDRTVLGDVAAIWSTSSASARETARHSACATARGRSRLPYMSPSHSSRKRLDPRFRPPSEGSPELRRRHGDADGARVDPARERAARAQRAVFAVGNTGRPPPLIALDDAPSCSRHARQACARLTSPAAQRPMRVDEPQQGSGTARRRCRPRIVSSRAVPPPKPKALACSTISAPSAKKRKKGIPQRTLADRSVRHLGREKKKLDDQASPPPPFPRAARAALDRAIRSTW